MIFLTALQSSVKLIDGNLMPMFGLGVFKAEPGQSTYSAVRCALTAGYRHIDTAAYYRNEADVGQAIRDSGIPREQIFVTTKLWTGIGGPIDYQGVLFFEMLVLAYCGEEVGDGLKVKCANGLMETASFTMHKTRHPLSAPRLAQETQDGVCGHVLDPQPQRPRQSHRAGRSPMENCRTEMPRTRQKYHGMVTLLDKPRKQWRALEAAKGAGLTRSIGVSNYGVHHLQELEKACHSLPATNQVEYEHHLANISLPLSLPPTHSRLPAYLPYFLTSCLSSDLHTVTVVLA